MAITFDKTNKVILVEASQTEVSIQSLVDAIRGWQDQQENMEVEEIISASGKQILTEDTKVGITLELINNWRVQFEDRSPPDYIACKVSGGNLVATNDYGDNPIKASAYTQVTTAQSSSATITETGTSGLTGEESDKLASLPSASENAEAVWDEPKAEHSGEGSVGKAIQDVEANAKFLRGVEGGRWKIINNQMIFYDSDNETELARFNLFDKSGKPAMEKVYERKRV